MLHGLELDIGIIAEELEERSLFEVVSARDEKHPNFLTLFTCDGRPYEHGKDNADQQGAHRFHASVVPCRTGVIKMISYAPAWRTSERPMP